jgi:DNA-binding transcriptional LysR family regulator
MDLPLSLLRAFEAAAREGSFSSAAANIGRTPSAISHAVRKLEESLGTALFERNGRNLRLTADGIALFRRVGPAFDELRRGVDVVSARGPSIVRVHSAPSFAAQWLTPRLASFLSRYPETEIRLAASTDYCQFTTDDFDVDIVYRRPNVQNVNIIPLGEETVAPLCCPELARNIARPEDLLRQTLIDSDFKQVRWNDWFAANGLSAPPQRTMRFDRSFISIKAAVDGLGVTLESTRLAERELEAGHLVKALGETATDITYTGHYLVFPDHALTRRTLRNFVSWLLAELGLSRQLEDAIGSSQKNLA